jgi:hypothetical protein
VSKSPADEPASARRRGSKGGTRKKKAEKQPTAESAPSEASASKSRARGSRGGRGKRKATNAPKAEEAPTVVRTGSTDRHQLIVEEVEPPILPATPQPPRTFRDLDEIPDDFD